MDSFTAKSTDCAGMLASLAARFVRLVAMMALIAGPAVPAHATAVASGQGLGASAWIEICADGGAAYVRVEGDFQIFEAGSPDDPSHDDCDCAFCLCGILQVGIGALPVPTDVAVPFRAEMTARLAPADESALPMAAEQFWSISRDPPDQQEKKSMTCISHDPTVRDEPSAFGPENGGFPWA